METLQIFLEAFPDLKKYSHNFVKAYYEDPSSLPVKQWGPFENEFNELYHEELKAVLKEVLLKLKPAKRRTGIPYVTHPIQITFILKWLLQDQAQLRKSAIFGLLHDYLEEGDGVNPSGIQQMRKALPTLNKELAAAVLLSEPEINLKEIEPSLVDARDRKMIRDTSYIVHVHSTAKMEDSRAFANCCIADKIDNSLDLDYVFGSALFETQMDKVAKFTNKLAYFKAIEEIVGPRADAKLLRIFSALCSELTKKYALSQEAINGEHQKFMTLFSKHRAKMVQLIDESHQALGLKI